MSKSIVSSLALLVLLVLGVAVAQDGLESLAAISSTTTSSFESNSAALSLTVQAEAEVELAGVAIEISAELWAQLNVSAWTGVLADVADWTPGALAIDNSTKTTAYVLQRTALQAALLAKETLFNTTKAAVEAGVAAHISAWQAQYANLTAEASAAVEDAALFAARVRAAFNFLMERIRLRQTAVLALVAKYGLDVAELDVRRLKTAIFYINNKIAELNNGMVDSASWSIVAEVNITNALAKLDLAIAIAKERKDAVDAITSALATEITSLTTELAARLADAKQTIAELKAQWSQNVEATRQKLKARIADFVNSTSASLSNAVTVAGLEAGAAIEISFNFAREKLVGETVNTIKALLEKRIKLMIAVTAGVDEASVSVTVTETASAKRVTGSYSSTTTIASDGSDSASPALTASLPLLLLSALLAYLF